jgi:hypothetical protein
MHIYVSGVLSDAILVQFTMIPAILFVATFVRQTREDRPNGVGNLDPLLALHAGTITVHSEK